MILCSLQLLVGASTGADSKGETLLGMYATDNTLYIYTATKELVLYTYNIPSLVPRPSLPPVASSQKLEVGKAWEQGYNISWCMNLDVLQYTETM